jgi:hypothetical protein
MAPAGTLVLCVVSAVLLTATILIVTDQLGILVWGQEGDSLSRAFATLMVIVPTLLERWLATMGYRD